VLGLNNPGAYAVVENLAAVPATIPVGVSVAKTPDPKIMGDAGVEDFIDGVMTLYDRADYLALNISCPNTAEGKTFEDPALLEALLAGIRRRAQELESSGTPVFLKLSPDIAPATLEKLLALVMRYQINGLIISNTTTSREGLTTDPARVAEIGRGGLSGRPLRERALKLVAQAYRATNGTLPIMGCGGIFNAEDAYRFIRAGASLVQIYTGMIFRGPWLMRDMNRDLLKLLERDGFSSIAEAVGADQR
jgi:dihydroorotate dehydrogenase